MPRAPGYGMAGLRGIVEGNPSQNVTNQLQNDPKFRPHQNQGPSYMNQMVGLMNQLPGQLPAWHQQAQNMFGQAGGALNQMGNVAGQMSNWGTQNPYAQQLQGGLNQMQQGGFNQGQLGQFMGQFNPVGGGGQMPQPGQRPPSGTVGPGGMPPPTHRDAAGYYDWRGGQAGMPPMPGGGPQLNSPINAGGQAPPPPTQGPGTGLQGQMGGGGGMPPQPPAGGNQWGVGLNQAQPMNTLGGFVGQQSNVPTPQDPQAGAGAGYINQLLGSGTATPQGFGGYGGQVEQARTAQLQNAMGMLQAPGISQQERGDLFAAEFDPVQRAIEQQTGRSMEALSARGMGQSSAALGNINQAAQQQLAGAAQGIGAGITGRHLDLAQRQREAGLGNLQNLISTGQTGTLGAGQLGQSGQQIAGQYNLGLGNLGLGSEQMGAQTGLAMNEQQMAAQNQQFSQDSARAGLDLSRYQTEQGFNMDQYKADLQGAVQKGQLDEQTAARLGNQALQQRGQDIQAGLGTLGYGLEAQNMQNQANQAYVNSILGAGGQNLQALQGAGGLYGNLAGQAGGFGFGMEDLYRDPMMQQTGYINQRNLQQRQLDAQNQGGGIGGFLGSLGGMAAGSVLGPLGSAAGGALGNSLFGGGQQGGAYLNPNAIGVPPMGLQENRNWRP